MGRGLERRLVRAPQAAQIRRRRIGPGCSEPKQILYQADQVSSGAAEITLGVLVLLKLSALFIAINLFENQQAIKVYFHPLDAP